MHCATVEPYRLLRGIKFLSVSLYKPSLASGTTRLASECFSYIYPMRIQTGLTFGKVINSEIYVS